MTPVTISERTGRGDSTKVKQFKFMKRKGVFRFWNKLMLGASK
jgi:hypothetical protein